MRVTSELFLDGDGNPINFLDAVIGGLSVGTPGAVAMLGRAHAAHGRLPWAELFQDAIDLAETGFPIGQRLATMLSGKVGTRLRTFPEARQYFFPNNVPLKAGQIVRNKNFAATLSIVAEQGPGAFYHGQIAKDIVETVQNVPERAGYLELDDFANYQAVERPPVCYTYREYRICGMGPPSSGAVTIGQILGILEHFELASLGVENPLSWHLLIEASKLAFSDRNQYVADPKFVAVPVDDLLNPEYLRQRAKLIDLQFALPTPVEAGQPSGEQTVRHSPDSANGRSGTSHFSIIDRYGNAVSMTSTIEGPFGSQLMVNGFLLNNELTDFSFVAQRNGQLVANRVEPGKRPRSSMSPTLVFNADGSLRLIIGSPGGSRIIGYVVKTLIAVLDWGMSVQDSIELHHVINQNGVTELEKETAAQWFLQPKLSELGHQLRLTKLVSGLHGIEFVDGALLGGADHRREGVALGLSSKDINELNEQLVE